MSPETKYSNRSIPKISLRDFESRIDAITASLVAAAETDGFFIVVDHGISAEETRAQFAQAERFFALDPAIKATVPFNTGAGSGKNNNNTGWESCAQVRPSTGQSDQKESYQIQYSAGAMAGAWLPEETLPGFRSACLSFMRKAQAVSEKIMICLARGLGFDDERYFVRVHDIASDPEVQTVLRLLHYFPLDVAGLPVPDTHCRAGAHTDWDLVTLLFQRPGENGLEICPGREAVTEFGLGDTWTKVEPAEGEIICNIGDLLMRWSDDRFKSTFHRVQTPRDPKVDHFGSRYSMAYFNQPTKKCLVQGPLKKYPPVSGADFIQEAIKRNYAALEARRAQDQIVQSA